MNMDLDLVVVVVCGDEEGGKVRRKREIHRQIQRQNT